MRRHPALHTLPTLLLALAMPARAEEDPAVGHWEGACVREGSIQTVRVDIPQDRDGLTGTCDVPDLAIPRFETAS